MKIKKSEKRGNKISAFLSDLGFICYNYLWSYQGYSTRHFQRDAQDCINYVKRK